MFNFIKKYKDVISLILVIVIVYAFYSLIGIGCPIKYLTGISCPGCGMTRAFKSLLSLDIKSAFNYHPGFILVIIAAITILLRKKISDRTYKLILSIVVLGLIVIYIVRIVNGSEIVVISPKDGLIYRTLSSIMGR